MRLAPNGADFLEHNFLQFIIPIPLRKDFLMSITMTIVGYVGQDPIQRTVNTVNGQQLVTNFSVASNNPRQPGADATWYRVTIWGPYGNSIMTNLSKGQHVTVIADDLRLNVYEAQDGDTRASLDVRAVSVNFDPRPAIRMSDEELNQVLAQMRSNTEQKQSTSRGSSRRNPQQQKSARSTTSRSRRQPAAGNVVAGDFAPPPDDHGDIPF
jgi:single stranded DNA-binding protein